MNRWDQEMLMGQISPEQLNYYGLMPDMNLRQADYGNSVSLSDIRPEENFLMRAQEVPSQDRLIDFSSHYNIPQELRPYADEINRKVAGSFGGLGGMAMQGLGYIQNKLPKQTPEEQAIGLSFGATPAMRMPIQRALQSSASEISSQAKNLWDATKESFGIGRLRDAGEAAVQGFNKPIKPPEKEVSRNLLNDIMMTAKEIFYTHNPEVGGKVNINLGGGKKTINDIYEGLVGVFKKEGKAGLQEVKDELLAADPGDLTALAARGSNKPTMTIYDNANRMGQDARQGVGEALNSALDPLSPLIDAVGNLSKRVSNAAGKAAPFAKPAYMDEVTRYASKQPGARDAMEWLRLLTGMDKKPDRYWNQRLSVPQKERYSQTGGADGFLEPYYKNMRNTVESMIQEYTNKGLDTIKSTAQKAAFPGTAGGILAMLPGADKTNAVASEPGLAKRMIDSLFGKGYDLGDIVDVPYSWKDGGGYIGRHEYNPKAATIRTNNMRDLSPAEKYALEQEARKYAGDFASAANVDGQLPGRKITMLPTYIKYLRDLL